MSLYVGINSRPKNIVSLLIGQNNAVKEVSEGYTGGLIQRILFTNHLT